MDLSYSHVTIFSFRSQYNPYISMLYYCNSIVVLSLLTESFDVAVFTVYSVLMNVNDLFTLIHFHLFQLDVI